MSWVQWKQKTVALSSRKNWFRWRSSQTRGQHCEVFSFKVLIMATTLRSLKIKTGVMKRLIKEFASYEKEVKIEEARLSKMIESGADPFDLKQQVRIPWCFPLWTKVEDAFHNHAYRKTSWQKPKLWFQSVRKGWRLHTETARIFLLYFNYVYVLNMLKRILTIFCLQMTMEDNTKELEDYQILQNVLDEATAKLNLLRESNFWSSIVVS